MKPIGYATWIVLGFEDFVAGFNALGGDPLRLMGYLESVEQILEDFCRSRWRPANCYHWIGVSDAYTFHWKETPEVAHLDPLATCRTNRWTYESDYDGACSYCLTRIPKHTTGWTFCDAIQNDSYCSESCGQRARLQILEHVPQLANRRPPIPMPADYLSMLTFMAQLPPITLADTNDPDPWMDYEPKFTIRRK